MKEYFSHDYNARNDFKMIEIRRAYGLEGIGLYWCLIEMMYERGGFIKHKDISSIAYELHITADFVENILNTESFVLNGDIFVCPSVNKRLKKREERSEKAKVSAEARWAVQRRNKNEVKSDKPQLYAIMCEGNGEEFVKVGITNQTVSRRYSSDKIPYEYKIILQVFGNDVLSLEKMVANKLSNYKYAPKLRFFGAGECFSAQCVDELLGIEFADYQVERNPPSQCGAIRRNAIKVKKSKEKNNPPIVPPKKEIQDQEKTQPNPSHLSENSEKEKPPAKDLVGFEEFWDEYHEKTKKPKTNRAPAEKHWMKLDSSDREQARDRIIIQVLQNEDPNYRPKARTYLADRRWEDELDERKRKKAEAAGLIPAREVKKHQVLEVQTSKSIDDEQDDLPF